MENTLKNHFKSHSLGNVRILVHEQRLVSESKRDDK